MAENEKKRLFIALNIPLVIKNKLADLLDELARHSQGIKWCQLESLHLTLHFLGYLDQATEKQVELIMQSYAGKFGSFEFKLGRINAFPNLNRPRVIFIECPQTNGRSIYKLQSLLGEKLAKLNIEVDRRPWQSHLTLGRVKQADGKFTSEQKEQQELTALTFKVDSFELMESELTRSGPIYKEVISYKL